MPQTDSQADFAILLTFALLFLRFLAWKNDKSDKFAITLGIRALGLLERKKIGP